MRLTIKIKEHLLSFFLRSFLSRMIYTYLSLSSQIRKDMIRLDKKLNNAKENVQDICYAVQSINKCDSTEWDDRLCWRLIFKHYLGCLELKNKQDIIKLVDIYTESVCYENFVFKVKKYIVSIVCVD